MRPAPGGLQSYLASNRFFVIADLYTFALQHGEVLRYSAFGTTPLIVPSIFDSHSLNFGGATFAIGPKFTRSKINTKIGVQTDTSEIGIIAGASDLLGTLTWQDAFRHGIFDGATVEIDRLVLQPSSGGFGVGAPVGAVVWFQGYVGDVEIGRTMITISANSMFGLLATQYPRRLWQLRCSHIFGDANCQYDRTNNSVAVMAQPGSAQQHIVTGFNPTPANLYDNGTIIGQSGQNSGYKRTISSANQGDQTAYLSTPYFFPVAIGDAFQMLPGCNHTAEMCRNTFNNLVHYGGQPYIPPAEFAI